MTMTTASLLARAQDGVVDEPDPAARPRRRSFTAEYKEAILAEYARCRSARPNRVRYFDARRCTRRTSPSGAKRGRRAPTRVWPPSRSSAVRPSRSSWRSCAAGTSGSRRSWPAPRPRWRSREKWFAGGGFPSRSVVAAGAVVTGELPEELHLYGGVPARAIKVLPPDHRFFTRKAWPG